jgi:hypothetical protein
MRAERYETASVSGTNTEDIANFINLYVDEAEFTKPVGQPSAAVRFAEWRRGHPGHFHLPERKLGFLEAEAIEGGADFRRAGQPGYFLLHRGI